MLYKDFGSKVRDRDHKAKTMRIKDKAKNSRCQDPLQKLKLKMITQFICTVKIWANTYMYD